MAFSIGKGRNEQGTFQQSTFIINYTRIQGNRNKSKHVYRRIESKSNTTEYEQCSIYSTYTVLLTDTAPPTFTQKKGKGHSLLVY